MVDLLVQSNIARYLEFRAMTRILSTFPDKKELLEVPCTRNDIFKCKILDVIEKRLLMRFLNNCLDFIKNNQTLEGDLEGKIIFYLVNYLLFLFRVPRAKFW